MNERNTTQEYRLIDHGNDEMEEKDENNSDVNVDYNPHRNQEEETFEEQETPKNNERPRRQVNVPLRFRDYEMDIQNDESFMAALFAGSLDPETPHTYSEAVSRGDDWKEAIQSELDALSRSETWEIVKRPKSVKVIDSRWVFRQKT